MAKYFEVQINGKLGETIKVRDNDTPEAWWRDNVTDNSQRTVVLNITAYPKAELVSIRDVTKDTYEFQRARVTRLASEIGKRVEFDETVTSIKFRVTEEGKKFKPTTSSDKLYPDLSPSVLSDKTDSWVKKLILKLAELAQSEYPQ
jgi:hypothetical protein